MSDEPTERDVEAMRAQRDRYRLAWQSARRRGVWRLRWNLGIHYAERIAQARREAWNEGWLTGFANCDERSPATPNPYRPAALRGDA